MPLSEEGVITDISNVGLISSVLLIYELARPGDLIEMLHVSFSSTCQSKKFRNVEQGWRLRLYCVRGASSAGNYAFNYRHQRYAMRFGVFCCGLVHARHTHSGGRPLSLLSFEPTQRSL